MHNIYKKPSTPSDCLQGVKTEIDSNVSYFTPLRDYCIKSRRYMLFILNKTRVQSICLLWKPNRTVLVQQPKH